MSGAERHRVLMRRLRSGESEALAASADMIEGLRKQMVGVEAVAAEERRQREAAERQVRDQSREIQRLKRELIEARTGPAAAK